MKHLVRARARARAGVRDVMKHLVAA